MGLVKLSQFVVHAGDPGREYRPGSHTCPPPVPPPPPIPKQTAGGGYYSTSDGVQHGTGGGGDQKVCNQVFVRVHPGAEANGCNTIMDQCLFCSDGSVVVIGQTVGCA
jgi:hypothetical protein